MGNFIKGDRAGIMLKANSANESFIKGINKLGLPAMSRATAIAQEFRTDFDIEFTTSGKWGQVKYSGNLVKGDTKGQDQLKAYLVANEEFNDARIYINDDDFQACDLANDPDSCFQVIDHTPGEVGKEGLFPISGTWTVGGRLAWFLVHMTDVAAPTLAFVAAVTPGTTSATITDSASGFVTAGFVAGQTLIVEGSTSNDGQYTILTVAAGTLTLKVGDVLSAEASIAGCTLHGGQL